MQEIDGFQVFDKELVFEDWFKVYKQKAIQPTGKEFTYCYGEQKDGVIILALTAKQEVVMIKEFRMPFKKTLTQLPCGIIEEGESPKEAAARELQEETGYKAKKIVRLTSMYPTAGMLKFTSNLFFASELEFVGQNLEEEENIEVILIPLAEFEQMVKEGYLEGGMMLAYYISKDKELF